MGLFTKLFCKKERNQATTAIKDFNSITPSTQYIETGSSIQRVDGKPISDEEVPYLMQLGYEKALQKGGLYTGQSLNTSNINRDLPEKKFILQCPPTKICVTFR